MKQIWISNKKMEKIHEKIWGREEWIANTNGYCGKLLYLEKGKRCSLHYHKNKDETFYVLRGRVLMEIENKDYIMKKGDFQRITPLTYHRFSGLKKSVIVEFSTHHEESDSYRQEESGDVPKDVMWRYNKK